MTRREAFQGVVRRIDRTLKEEGEGVRSLESLQKSLTVEDVGGILWARARIAALELAFLVGPDVPTHGIGSAEEVDMDELRKVSTW